MVKLPKKSVKLKKRFRIIFILFIICILLLQSIPTVFSNSSSGITTSTSDFGVLLALDQMLQDKDSKLNSPEIENETKNRLDQMKLVKYDRKSTAIDYQVKSVKRVDPKYHEHAIFKALEEHPLINNTSLLDLIIQQPLNYWIYTRSNASTTWTKALLRRSLILPKFNPTRWEYIDVDNNPSNGNEIRVRFDIIIDDWEFQRPTIIPRTSANIKIKGGVGVSVERLANRTFPLELFIVKSISYEGENYIWNTGMKFDETPISYQSTLLAETIELEGLGETLINAFLQGNVGNLINTTLAEINGPYTLRFGFDSDIRTFNLMAGLVKYENRSLTDKNWLTFYVTPAEGYDYVTRSGEIWVDSSNIQAPIDNLKWTSGVLEQASQYKIPINLKIRYGEERGSFIFADVDLINLPEWFTLKIDYTQIKNNNNITVIDYSAADTLDVLNYTTYFYPDYSNDPELTKINCTHVQLVDVPKRLHMEMTSEIGRDINTTVHHNPQNGIVANIIDNLIVRFANRFYRIGKYLKLAAEGLLELPGKEGWGFIDTYDEKFTSIDFYQTSGDYVTSPGNYFAFYNYSNPFTARNSENATNTSEDNSTQDDFGLLTFAISGRLSNLQLANLSFGRPLELELKGINGEPLTGLFIDGENYAIASISNVPQYIRITSLGNNSFYSTIDPESDSDAADGETIDQFTFTSRFGQQLLELQIKQIPVGLEFSQKKDVITFSSLDDDYIDELNYIITNDVSKPIHQLEASNNIFIHQDQDIITSTGRLSGLKSLTYDTSEDGFFELKLNQETPFQVMLIDNKVKLTKAKVILDPLPNNFRLELPGIIKQTNIDFPDMTNLTGFVDYSQMVFTLGKLGEEAVNLLGNMSQNLIDSIGNIGFNFSISYELESYGKTLDMIAEIERGGTSVTDSSEDPYSSVTDDVLGNTVGWTHGICMSQDTYEDNEILRGHLFLKGMPRAGSISTEFTDNTTKVNLDFQEYSPTYDWLLIDLKGVQNRDVIVFFQRVPGGVDFKASADLTTNLEIGGELLGVADISIKDTGTDSYSKELGGLFITMHTYEPIQSIREFYISELPPELHINFSIRENVNFLYDASNEIDFIYSKLSKILTDSWHHVNLILHELPKWFKFNFRSNTDFSIEDPLPLQGMPIIDIDTKNTDTLDIIISLEGAAVGQRGNVDLYIQNVQNTYATLKDNSYNIESDGLEYLRLKITNLPILDNYKLNSLSLEAEDLTSLEFKVNLLFGVFPYFDLGSSTEGKVEVNIDHTIELFGEKKRAHVALIDLVYEDVGGIRIPVGTPIFVNTINSDLSRSRNHLILPAPLISLILTWAWNI